MSLIMEEEIPLKIIIWIKENEEDPPVKEKSQSQ